MNIVVPEVYDPKTDRNIALENARMAFPLYPQMEVVQTGPGQDDWKVCTFDGEINYGPELNPGWSQVRRWRRHASVSLKGHYGVWTYWRR